MEGATDETMDWTIHCRSGHEEIAVTVGTKEALETLRSVNS